MSATPLRESPGADLPSQPLPTKPSRSSRPSGPSGRKRRKLLQPYRRLFTSTHAASAYGQGRAPYCLDPESDVDGVEPLEPGYVNGVYWTARQKEEFFAALAAGGRTGLGEVEEYLGVLAEGVRELGGEGVGVGVGGEDVLAAVEVGEGVEGALEGAAGELREAEGVEEGEGGVVDTEAAEAIERALEAREDAAAEASVEAANTSTHAHEPDDASTTPHLTSATTLSNPSTLLHLSRTLYMNSSTSPDTNWHTLNPHPTPPAITHSALNALQTLIRTTTHSLVAATIFQATSRLRGRDDRLHAKKPPETDSRSPATPQPPPHSTPATAPPASSSQPSITATDVTTARAILGWSHAPRTYWARAPRRCGVVVYSHGAEFARGRAPGRNGHRLSWGEVEGALGVPVDGGGGEGEGADGVGAEDVTDVDADAEEVESMGTDELAEREEDGYLEALDQRARRAEERRLWEIFRIDMPEEEGESDQDEAPIRAPPRKRKRADGGGKDWWEKTPRVAEWEMFPRLRWGEGRGDGRDGDERGVIKFEGGLDGVVEGGVTSASEGGGESGESSGEDGSEHE